MKVRPLGPDDEARFQGSAFYVAGIDGSGNPQSLADAVAEGLSGGSGVTAVSISLGASDTVTIPIGAKGWTVTILTGTGTINGVAGLPAGFSDSDPQTLVAAITVATASASSAYVRYNT